MFLIKEVPIDISISLCSMKRSCLYFIEIELKITLRSVQSRFAIYIVHMSFLPFDP